jgi:adenylosuccinate synthase
VNGLTEIGISKLDILSGLNFPHIATTYQRKGEKYIDLPEGPFDLDTFTPIYEKLRGWETDLWEIRQWQDLPLEAQNYILTIEELIATPVSIISVGPERDQVVHREIKI